MYNKLSGMTGTAATEEKEFQDIYGMDVVIAPTNMPMIREDYPDLIYKTEKAKFNAVIEEIIEYNGTGAAFAGGHDLGGKIGDAQPDAQEARGAA